MLTPNMRIDLKIRRRDANANRTQWYMYGKVNIPSSTASSASQTKDDSASKELKTSRKPKEEPGLKWDDMDARLQMIAIIAIQEARQQDQKKKQPVGGVYTELPVGGEILKIDNLIEYLAPEVHFGTIRRRSLPSFIEGYCCYLTVRET